MTTIETACAPFQHGYRYWTKVHRYANGEVRRLSAHDLVDAGVNVGGRSRHDGGLLIVVTIPDGSAPLPGQPNGVARMRLPTGDILVARQRDTDPDGPWALSVERAVDADHRERLRLLSGCDAHMGDLAYTQQRAAKKERTRVELMALAEKAGPLPTSGLAPVADVEESALLINPWSAECLRLANGAPEPLATHLHASADTVRDELGLCRALVGRLNVQQVRRAVARASAVAGGQLSPLERAVLELPLIGSMTTDDILDALPTEVRPAGVLALYAALENMSGLGLLGGPHAPESN
jgi:hypothetical protein